MPIQVNRNAYPVTIERGKIKEFARALGDLNSAPTPVTPACSCATSVSTSRACSGMAPSRCSGRA